jgi:rhizosphere induced protein
MKTERAYARKCIWIISTRVSTLIVLMFLLTVLNRPTAMAQAVHPPIGSVMAWAGPMNSIPNNYMVCDGRELDRPQFQALFNAVGTTWGGTAVNKFKIPDLRGLFLRGVDGGTGRDPDSTSRTPAGTSPVTEVGSVQQDALQSHKHEVSVQRDKMSGSNGTKDVERGDEKFNSDPGLGSIGVTIGNPLESTGGAVRQSSETRPKNAYVYWIIRVK